MEKLKIERNSVLSSKYFCVIFCIFCVFPLVNPKIFGNLSENAYLCSVMKNVSFFEFPRAKSVVVSGDIHGDFTQLVYKCCVQYEMTDTLIIVAGDCGYGHFHESWHAEIDDVMFHMLDIMELREMPPK